jgi:hypothetical protein
MTRAEAEIEVNRGLDRILDLLAKPTPELQAAIRLSAETASTVLRTKAGEKARTTPDYDAICQRAIKSLTSEGL